MFWGLSPSLDLYQEYLQAYKNDKDKKDKKGNKNNKVASDTNERKEAGDNNEKAYNSDESNDNKENNGDEIKFDMNSVTGPIDNKESQENEDNNFEKSDCDEKKESKEEGNANKINRSDNTNNTKDTNNAIEEIGNTNDTKNDKDKIEISQSNVGNDKNDNEDNNDNTVTEITNNHNNTNNSNDTNNDTNYSNDNINKDDNEKNENKNNENNNDNKDCNTNKNAEVNSLINNDTDTKDTETNEDKTDEKQNKEAMGEKINSSGDIPYHPKSLNILLFGAGDPRHVIHTIAKQYTHCPSDDPNCYPELNFYIVEGCIEIVARSIALLGIALEQPDVITLRNKVHLFMDIYGNTMMRPTSHLYLMAKAKSLLKIITDDEQMKRLAPFLSIDGLKYRERDGLENSFNFWLPKPEHVFNITEYWTVRLRTLLGTRYDHREGAFDWDLSMTLKYREGKQICSQEYRYWRETGVAFTYPEYEQCKPNKTLSAGLVRNGKHYMHRGYVGDIQTGPFCTFGLRASDQRFSKSVHGDNDYRSTDVTERNLLELFYEIQERKPYIHDNEMSRKLGSVKLQMGKIFTWNECDLNAMQDNEKPWQQMRNVKVHFLSADEVFGLQDDTNGRWRNFFDVAFVGHNYFAFVKSTFGSILRENSLLIMETKLMTMARKEGVTEFETKLKNFAKSANLENVLNYNAINGQFSMLKFRKKVTADGDGERKY